MAQTKEGTHVRWLIRKDMPSILAIEGVSFGSHAWTEEEFLAELRMKSCIGMVAEYHGEIAGHVIYHLRKGYLEIRNFAVHPRFRRMGVGTAMVKRISDKLSQQRRRWIELVVGERNLDGQLFFKAVGFRAEGVLREYFDDRQDGYMMTYRVDRIHDEMSARDYFYERLTE